MEVKLKSHIHIRCGGISHYDHTCKIDGRGAITPVIVPIVQAPDCEPHQSQETAAMFSSNPYTTSTQKATTPSAALDLGTHFSLFLGAGSPKREIYPTFATYNIAISHSLKWKIRLSCAGRTRSIGGEPDVTLLAPSEEQEAEKRQLGTAGM